MLRVKRVVYRVWNANSWRFATIYPSPGNHVTRKFQTPNHSRRSYARTNVQTVLQRAEIIGEILPGVQSIAEVCCGDCFHQWETYKQRFNLSSFIGLDIDCQVVASNQALGIGCRRGDANDIEVVKTLLPYELIFFGPPLSVACEGHSLIPFQAVMPSYTGFTEMLFGELNYQGTVVCTASKHTSMGDIRWLYDRLTSSHRDVGLPLVHYSYSTVTGAGEITEERRKYIEMWFSTTLRNSWEIRTSRGASQGGNQVQTVE